MRYVLFVKLQEYVYMQEQYYMYFNELYFDFDHWI